VRAARMPYLPYPTVLPPLALRAPIAYITGSHAQAAPAQRPAPRPALLCGGMVRRARLAGAPLPAGDGGGIPRRRLHAPDRPHWRRQNPLRLPAIAHRHPRDGRARHPHALRLAAEGAHQRHRAQPVTAHRRDGARRDRREPHGRHSGAARFHPSIHPSIHSHGCFIDAPFPVGSVAGWLCASLWQHVNAATGNIPFLKTWVFGWLHANPQRTAVYLVTHRAFFTGRLRSSRQRAGCAQELPSAGVSAGLPAYHRPPEGPNRYWDSGATQKWRDPCIEPGPTLDVPMSFKTPAGIPPAASRRNGTSMPVRPRNRSGKAGRSR
jgi:hypothetical protein